jgi:aspartyl-tRNA(Asn)/glutamyl-tRNA(Gln) amidotransferase subunit C
MEISTEEVKKIAYLARLGIDENDVGSYAKDLSGLLGLVELLQEVETDGVHPMAHPLDQAQRLRPDAVTESNQRDHFQTIAPAVQDGLYLVPKVIE